MTSATKDANRTKEPKSISEVDVQDVNEFISGLRDRAMSLTSSISYKVDRRAFTR